MQFRYHVIMQVHSQIMLNFGIAQSFRTGVDMWYY